MIPAKDASMPFASSPLSLHAYERRPYHHGKLALLPPRTSALATRRHSSRVPHRRPWPSRPPTFAEAWTPAIRPPVRAALIPVPNWSRRPFPHARRHTTFTCSFTATEQSIAAARGIHICLRCIHRSSSIFLDRERWTMKDRAMNEKCGAVFIAVWEGVLLRTENNMCTYSLTRLSQSEPAGIEPLIWLGLLRPWLPYFLSSPIPGHLPSCPRLGTPEA